MPSKNDDDDKNKNLTLRLPEGYHRQLTGQASRLGLTLNGHLVNIVHKHLLETGYAPNVLKSFSGRLFEIEVEPVRDRPSDYFYSRFDVYEIHPLYNKRRAHYLIAVSYSLLRRDEDPYQLVEAVGLALLNFYNRSGLEVDQLGWQTGPNNPPSPSPTMKDNWRHIGSSVTKNIDEFLITLAKNHWKDDLLVSTGQSQDIRCNLRSESDLYR